jgi:Ca2+-binding EF-hand superfamily protein
MNKTTPALSNSDSGATIPRDNKSPPPALSPLPQAAATLPLYSNSTGSVNTADSSSDEEDDSHLASPRQGTNKPVGRILPVIPTLALPAGGLELPGTKATSAFVDPFIPQAPADPRPLYLIQEEARMKTLRKKIFKSVSLEERQKASLNGTLVGMRIASPIKRVKVSRAVATNGSITSSFSPEDAARILYIADDIISCADQGTADRSISINEMQIFLKSTPYEEFMNWLTGIDKVTKKSRFHEIDIDDSQSIELLELRDALSEYLMENAALEVLHEVAMRNQQRLESAREARKTASLNATKKAGVKAKKRAQELAQKKIHDAAELIKHNTAKLNTLRHRFLAASYTSFGFDTDLASMFQSFDVNGDGTLDCAELINVVRRFLKIAPITISDADLEILFNYLDKDNGGEITNDELVDFLKEDVSEESVVIPEHLLHVEGRTNLQKLTDLINFKTPEELVFKEPRYEPGEIPWNRSTKTPRMNTTYQITGIGTTKHVPQGYETPSAIFN